MPSRGRARTGGAPCAPESERLVLRALDAQTGGTSWEVSVLPVDAPGTLYEASLVPGGAVGTLTDVARDGGPLAHVQLFAQGERVAVCALKDRPRIAGAAHVGRFLYVVLEREGTWRLEAFDLGAFGLRRDARLAPAARRLGHPARGALSGLSFSGFVSSSNHRSSKRTWGGVMCSRRSCTLGVAAA